MPLAYPKPKDIKTPKPSIKVYPDGREVCVLTDKRGMDEYLRRKRVAWEAQDKKCSLCGERLNWSDSTVDHIKIRGMGGANRDDRQENIAAAHGICNAKRGSRRKGYYGQ